MTAGLIILLIAILAFLGFLSIVRQLFSFGLWTIKLVFRLLWNSAALAKKMIVGSAEIVRTISAFVITAITAGTFCYEKAKPIAVSAARSCAGMVRQAQMARRRTIRPILNPQPRHTGTWFRRSRAVLWCGFAPATVLAAFIVMSGLFQEEWTRWQPEGFKRVNLKNEVLRRFALSRNRASRVVKEIPAIPSHPVDSTNAIVGTGTTANRPAWIAEGDRSQGEVAYYVLSSELWSTIEEANERLNAKVTEIVQRDFEQRHHGPFDPRSTRALNEQHVVETAVKNRYLEKVEQDFGKFTEPMYRLWAEVEISPIVRTELYSEWKTAIRQNKILCLGSTFAIATLIACVVGSFASPRQKPATSMA